MGHETLTMPYLPVAIFIIVIWVVLLVVYLVSSNQQTGLNDELEALKKRFDDADL